MKPKKLLVKKSTHPGFISDQSLLPFWLLGSAIFTAIIHNVWYAIFKTEEASFFILTLILITAFFASVIYNIITYLNRGEPADIWKMGWLGVVGVLTPWASILVIFYAFFAFFGLKKPQK
ncbi:MAG: hypothetical protein RB292_01170 [Patescibacteria group bacterium]|jgi:hypothetical protein|nr:hypothetical protein [Patescibacteria group bacterium]